MLFLPNYLSGISIAIILFPFSIFSRLLNSGLYSVDSGVGSIGFNLNIENLPQNKKYKIIKKSIVQPNTSCVTLKP